MKAWFITATDTDAGKTFVTCGLLNALSKAGYATLGFKPVASGGRATASGLRNGDALKIIQASTLKPVYEVVNQYIFEAAIAPHIAAEITDIDINLKAIVDNIHQNSLTADIVLVEGVGGWLVPLNNTQTIASLAKALDFPVLLVVNMRLGCINHALLTMQSIAQQGLKLDGWIANTGQSDESMDCLEQNIDSLKQLIPAPLLAVLPELNSSDDAYWRTFSRFAEKLCG